MLLREGAVRGDWGWMRCEGGAPEMGLVPLQEETPGRAGSFSLLTMPEDARRRWLSIRWLTRNLPYWMWTWDF